MRTPPPVLLSFALAGLLVAGCGSSSDDADRPAATGVAGFPVTVDDCGRDVVVEAPPQRAVSLNQGSTEILLSLGLADRMVGTATWTDPVLPDLADANDGVERLADNAPSYERVLETEPDLVTASFAGTLGEGGVTSPDALERLGVPSYLSPAECGKQDTGEDDGARTDRLEMDAVYEEITELATIFGVPERGEALVASLQDRMTAASASVDATGVDVAYWFANAESPYLGGCCGAPGVMTRALGATNVFDDTTSEWPQVNWETVADRDPDVLVLGDLTRKSQTAESAAAKIEFLETNPVTREMTAVREGRYVEVAGGDLNPSIRTVDGTEKLAAGIRELGLDR
ncbi:MAG: ABC transporter substrate-binding protein [Nocardioidaceae bacterium]|nr:ABC transporter substrate-binding protein [Nocardioidaceae bacterium]